MVHFRRQKQSQPVQKETYNWSFPDFIGFVHKFSKCFRVFLGNGEHLQKNGMPIRKLEKSLALYFNNNTLQKNSATNTMVLLT